MVKFLQRAWHPWDRSSKFPAAVARQSGVLVDAAMVVEHG